MIIQRRKDRWAVSLHREKRKVWSAIGDNLGDILDKLRGVVEEFGRLGQ